MSFTESVIDRTRRIEKLLAELGGKGRGAHDLATSISSVLGDSLLRRLRFAATIRNKLLHEDGYTFNGDQQRFLSTCDGIISQLTALLAARAQKASADFSPTQPKIVLPVQTEAAIPTPQPIVSGPVATNQVQQSLSRRQSQPGTTLGVGCIAVIVCTALILVALPFTCTRSVEHGIWPFNSYEEVTNWNEVQTWAFIWLMVAAFIAYYIPKRR